RGGVHGGGRRGGGAGGGGRRGPGDDVPGAGVADDQLRLGRGGRGVHGHGHAARGPYREVQDRPLVAGAGHHRDPVPRPETGRDQALGHGGDLPGEGRRRDRVPGALPFAAQY